MKYPTKSTVLHHTVKAAIVLWFGFAQASLTEIATTPMITSDNNATAVKPNLMFILDDSGSMDWDFLPDWSNDYYCKRANGSVNVSGNNDGSSVNSLCCRNRSGSSDSCMYGTDYSDTGSSARRADVPLATSDFNRAYYNPAITYTPPKNADGTSKSSQTCEGSGGTVSGSGCTGGWASVKLDAYGIQEASGTTLNLISNFPDVEWCTDTSYTNCRKNTNYFYPNSVFKYFRGTRGAPYYYLMIPGEYCSSDKLMNCVTSSSPTGIYTVPAKLRWCSDTALTTCQAIKNDTYKYPRYPTLMRSNSDSGSVTTIVTVTGSSTAASNKPLVVNSFGVATGPALISAATASTNDVDTATQRLIDNTASAYTASGKTCSTSSGTRTCTFAVLAPASGTCPSGAFSSSLSHGSGSVTMTVSASPQFTNCRVPGSFVRVDIESGNNSYPYPGQLTKAASRTDCSGTTCTYLEEMANFANWFTYYRTRMQMMKTAASLAFHGVSDNFRVGYLSINANASNSYLNIDTFNSTQKTSWYSKLFNANPNNGTPLRSALSTAGLLYGGSLNGLTLNGSTVIDPVQYSCQKNFAILSTDGYWNTGNDSGCSSRSGRGCRLDRTSAIGNTDGGDVRPYSDGASATVTTVTPYTTVVRQQSVQGATNTTPWLRTVTTHQGACSVSNPGPAGACYQDNGKNSANKVRTWCMEADNSRGYDCISFGANPKAWACRGGSNSTNTPGGVDLGCVKDGANPQVEWCLYPNNTTSGTSSCSRVYSNNSLYVCKRGVLGTTPGTMVRSQPQTYSQVAVGSRTIITDATTNYNQTVVTVNGVQTSSTTSTPATSTSTVSDTLAAISDTGAPVADTTWVNGTYTEVCMTSPTAEGTSSPVAGSPTTSATGAAIVSTLSTSGPSAGTPSVTTATSGGVSDTLADVAYYYYNTDLRAAASMNNGVDVGTGDYDAANGVYTNNIQRMISYTLGLGIDGFMKFKPNYTTVSSGDFFDVANGVTAAGANPNENPPTDGHCTWQTAGTTCNWPTPASDSQANIDDLWHAAVNGRGQYFSAGDPAALAAGLSGALSSISAKLGAAAAATTSNPNITTGDNFLFSSDFKTSEWVSQLQRQQIDVATGNIVTSGSPPQPVVDWDAQELLDVRVTPTTDDRQIFTFTDETETYSSGLKPFLWGNLTSSEKDNFSATAMASLPQFCATATYTLTGDSAVRNCLTSAEQTDAAGDKLIRFLRGQTGYEERTENTDAGRPAYYRMRTHTLGDIVSSEAVYVKQPLFNYADTGFTAFKNAQNDNPAMVYVAANDGMLHAFNATTGAEVWSYIPKLVMPKLYNLASMNYKNDHKFILDGTPVVDYAYFGGAWKTLLIAGLAAGGVGYYALDITDPENPKALWEFKKRTTSCAATVEAAIGMKDDCDLGYSYGNPVVTKLMDGTWVVLLTSGYNNTSPGDGKGYLYVLNPATGEIIRKIGTGAGSNLAISGVCDTAPCPSGLSKIAAWVDSPDTNNTTKRVYGGDLFGNLWRFDINNVLGSAGYEAQRLAILKGPAGTLQPVTGRPELAESNGVSLVLLGTGRFLGDSDKSDDTQKSSPTNNKQSFYAIKDPLTSSGWGNVRDAGFVQQTVSIDTNQNRTVSNNSVSLSSVPGWFIDLPDNGERSYTDPALALGTIIFTTNQPTGSACSSSGQSFIYNLDYRSGAAVSGFGGRKLANALATRPVVVQLQGGAIRSITRLGDTGTDVRDVQIGSSATNPRRVSWRQLIDQ